jgi:transposase-like protein
VFVKVPRTRHAMAAAVIRTIFAQPDASDVKRQFQEVAATKKRQFGVANEVTLEAAEDLTTIRHFPTNHRQQIRSGNPLERLNAEIKRRAQVVGVFPNDAAALGLITAVCVEQHDEWTVSGRRYLSQESMGQPMNS